tara:strand:+ start:5286 stop:6140 length:855 start_codon:yes stop_codon:yes gene_type:complete
MSRNNPERLGADVQPAEVPPTSFTETNNNLAFVVPTEFVDLPSRGQFYPPGHQLRGLETIEIKFMTAREEDILADKSLLKKGLSIDRLLRNIIVDRNINPDDFLVGDKNAILVACRISGYGEEYNTKVICPICLSHGRHEFDLSQIKIKYPENFKEFGIRPSPIGTFFVTAPRTGVEVELCLLTGHLEKTLLINEERRRKQNLPGQPLTDQLRMIIKSVDGEEDRSTVNSFIESLPAIDSRHIRTMHRKCTPGIDMKEDFACMECGTESVIDIPFTTDFFWPNT